MRKRDCCIRLRRRKGKKCGDKSPLKISLRNDAIPWLAQFSQTHHDKSRDRFEN